MDIDIMNTLSYCYHRAHGSISSDVTMALSGYNI